MSNKYNVITLFAKDMDKYAYFFEAHGIARSDYCTTAWDTFTKEAPGESVHIKVDGLSIYDLPEKLSEMGIYLYDYAIDQ